MCEEFCLRTGRRTPGAPHSQMTVVMEMNANAQCSPVEEGHGSSQLLGAGLQSRLEHN